MKYRSLVLFGVLAAMFVVVSVAMAGQAPRAAASTAAHAKPSTPARTAWGDPDLNGLWQGFTGVPLERPARVAGREFLTDAEMAAKKKGQEELQARVAAGKSYEFFFRGQANYNNIFFYDENLAPVSRRTSEIIDPPNGRLPPLTPEAVKRWEAREALSHGRGEADSYIDRSLGERCIIVLDLGRIGNWGLGDLLRMPTKGTGGVKESTSGSHVTFSDTRDDTVRPAGEGSTPIWRILQAPGFVAVVTEGVYRIIPLAGRPALGPTVRQYRGDSRGHWEGETLVVETANLNYPDPMMTAYGSTIYPGTGEMLRVTERYTRVDADRLEYRYTIDDPATYTQPYTVLKELTRNDSFAVAPDLCHENNKDLSVQLASARADEAANADFGAEFSGDRQSLLEELRVELAEVNKKR